MSDDTTHYPRCGLWNPKHARCATTDELIECLGNLVSEAYSDGISDGHPCSIRDRQGEERRRSDSAIYLVEVRRRIDDRDDYRRKWKEAEADVAALIAQAKRLDDALAVVRAKAFNECAVIADACANERMRETIIRINAGGAVESLMGKESEARRIAHEIRLRLSQKSGGEKCGAPAEAPR